MNSEGIVNCFPSSKDKCFTSSFLEGRRSDFHDGELQKATKEINGILDRVKRSNRDPSRHLAFIQVQNRMMLAWAQSGSIGSDADDEDIAKALRINSS